jgi:hypothetical protein
MRQNRSRSLGEAKIVKIFKNGKARLAIVLAMGVLFCWSALALAPQSRSRVTAKAAKSSVPPVVSPAAQNGVPSRGNVRARLSHQPEASKLSRALGQRFLAPGREVEILTGTVSIGADRHSVRLVRTQQDDGEQVAIALDGGPPSLTWNAADGAVSSGRGISASERVVVERLALDSPDQFVLAQLRGASYYTVARNVRPSAAEGSDDYSGPVWDVVRVAEPEAAGPNAPVSGWRLFHINASTGLIDRSISQEQGETIVAEISGWADRLGEKVPTHITWSRKGQVLMELSIGNVAHDARQ